MTHERWRRLTEWPMILLSLIFLAAYAWEVIGDLSPRETGLPDWVMTVIWVAFVLDYVVNLLLARPRGSWFISHLWELALVAVPAFRPLRLLRLLSIVVMLHRSTVLAVRGRVAVYVVSATSLLVLVAGIAVLDAEQHAAGSSIRSIGDAWWWSFATITTVGYGDYAPVTLAGRFVAVVLMGCGVALLGSVTALLASWIVEQVNGARGPRVRSSFDSLVGRAPISLELRGVLLSEAVLASVEDELRRRGGSVPPRQEVLELIRGQLPLRADSALS